MLRFCFKHDPVLRAFPENRIFNWDSSTLMSILTVFHQTCDIGVDVIMHNTYVHTNILIIIVWVVGQNMAFKPKILMLRLISGGHHSTGRTNF